MTDKTEQDDTPGNWKASKVVGGKRVRAMKKLTYQFDSMSKFSSIIFLRGRPKAIVGFLSDIAFRCSLLEEKHLIRN